MKILIVTTISNTVNLFLIPHIKMLIEEGHTVDVACNIQQELKPEIKELGCKIYKIPLQRSPINKNNIKAYKILKSVINYEEYDLVHTHTPVASAIVRLVCRGNSNIKVFYTVHGFHFYNGAPLINWLIYYPIEKWLSKYTDILITINSEDAKRATRKFNAKSVKYVPGVGIDTLKLRSVNNDRTKKRIELGIPKDSLALLSVGELNKNKNHEVVIRALASSRLHDVKYLICGEGPLDKYLIELSEKLGVKDRIYFLGFREDIPEICEACDLFIFPSFREGLSVALMEAMALGLPVICSNISGNNDLIDNNGGILVEPNNINEFIDAIIYMKDKSYKLHEIGNYNKNNLKKYELISVLGAMREIYRIY